MIDHILLEDLSASVHAAWMFTKLNQGVKSRKSETREELMVDYSDLSEQAKDLDRGSVRAVLNAIAATGRVIVDSEQAAAIPQIDRLRELAQSNSTVRAILDSTKVPS